MPITPLAGLPPVPGLSCPVCGREGVASLCPSCGADSREDRVQATEPSKNNHQEQDPASSARPSTKQQSPQESGTLPPPSRNSTATFAVALAAGQNSTHTPSKALPSNPDQALQELTAEEQAQVRELAQRDQEVRAHEQAHVAASGGYAGGVRYTYQRGPDGNQYAVGGEVSIDASPVPGDPEATMEKARLVRRAALAPAQPSAQDRAVASQASQMEAQARTEQQSERRSAGPENREPDDLESTGKSEKNGLEEISGLEPTVAPDNSSLPEKLGQSAYRRAEQGVYLSDTAARNEHAIPHLNETW